MTAAAGVTSAAERRADGDACPLCGRELVPVRDLGTYHLGYCNGCELGRLLPLPSDDTLRALYESPAYFSGEDAVGYADYEANAPQFARTFASKLGLLRRWGAIADLLEIGCGPGYFLAEAQREGIARVVGVDRSPWAIERARGRGIDARLGSVEAVAPDERFDACVMLDVLEHVTTPVPFLGAVRAHLRPGGRLMVMTPNIRSWLARAAGRRWVSFKVPEHVYYYTPRSMTALLGDTGFEVLTIRPSRQYVTVAFAAERLGDAFPFLRAAVAATVGRRRLADAVLPVPNGSIDVVARATP